MTAQFIDVLGFVAAVCTTLSFLPQALRVLRTRDARAISLGMYALFVTGVGCWLAYGVATQNWPIIVANAVTFALAGSILALKVRYG